MSTSGHSPTDGSLRRIDRALQAVALALTSYVLVGGIVSLLGWILDVPRMTDWDDDGISIQPNASVAALLTAVALVSLTARRTSIAAWLGAIVAFIGASALFEHMSGYDLSIDSLLMFERTWGRVGVLHPGRMGPPGATSWALLGTAIVLAARKPGSRSRALASAIGVLPAAIAMLSLVGYLYGASGLYTLPRVTIIALQTSSFIFAASIALLILVPERGPMQLVREDSTAGMLVRWTIPILVLVPVLIGYVRMLGEQAGHYDSSFGTAARTVVEIFVFAVLFWFFAQVIRKQSLRSAQAERALHASQTRLAETFETIADGFVTMDAEWRFTYVNAAAEALLGRKRAELIGRSAWNLFPESSGGDGHRMLAGAMTDRAPVEFEEFNPKLERWYSNNAYPTNDGGLAVYFQDVTLRRQQQVALEAKEAQLRHVADNAAVLVSQCSRDLRYVFVNRAYADLLHRTAEEIVGRRIVDVLGEPAFEVIRPYVERVLAGERVEYEAEIPFDGVDGYWMRVSYVPDRDPLGRVTGWIAAITNLTERKRAEEALRRQEELLRTVTQHAHVGLVIVSRERRYVYANAYYAEIIGVESMDLVGRRLDDVVGDLYGEAYEREVLPRLDSAFAGAHVQYELAVHGRAADLADRDVSVSYEPQYSDGVVQSVVVSVTDITRRKAIERERELLLERERVARTDAERNARLKDEFLTTLSHELRTPLNAVIGWTHLLRQDLKDPERARHAVDVIERNARNQAQLIADLLDMSSITSGKMRLDLKSVDLRDVVRGAIESIAPAADARGVRIDTELEPIQGVVYGDPERLQQVVWNLLSNAVKFTPRDGRVGVSVRSNEDHAAITVRDTGEGLSREFLPHVFDRFRQADASISRRHGGLGIGLALVKQFVELHGGSVSASSEGVGMGATFSVRIPLARAASDMHVLDAEPTTSMTPLTDLKILLVDDDRDALSMMRRILEEHGAAVELAQSADEGLRLLGDRAFDVIVSDIGMPIRDGYDLIADVRTRGIRVPALAVTAYASAEDRRRAIGAGYQAHVAKPVDTTEFLVAVAALAGRH